MRDFFGQMATKVSNWAGSYWAFLLAFLAIVVWIVSGPLFGFSDTWQLVINTATTIVTFLMVFLIQNSQNRESRAIQLKLDELIRALDPASNRLIDIEEATEEDLERLQTVYRNRAEKVRKDVEEVSPEAAEAVEEAEDAVEASLGAAKQTEKAAEATEKAAEATVEASDDSASIPRANGRARRP